MRADMFLWCKRKKRSTPVQSDHIHVLYRGQFCFYHQRETKMYDTVIKNVRILDGSGLGGERAYRRSEFRYV